MSEHVLEARDLARFYETSSGAFAKPATVRALDGASFDLEAGRTLAIVGESGCGKSTLARVLTMIEPPSRGELTIDGRTVSGKADPKLRQAIQIVFQNPFGSLNPRQKIGAILEEPLKLNTDVKARERKRRGLAMLERVGLRAEHYERYPHMFSGGQRQRIAIARALMLQPRVLVLDEPVSALDVSIQAQVLNILNDLQEEFGLAYVFISHDLSVVRHIADEILIMYLGRVVEHGSAKEVFAHPTHPYTAALLSATPVADPTREKNRIPLTGELPSPLDPPPGCPFNPRCWKAQADCTRAFPPDTGEAGHFAACYHPLAENETTA
ncbi:dipeptide ABC transporter ATP-binding protein [Pararhizobium mangrovi]|uniref:Dipeptide ABC transporter ATP-binding protein n=1 Tax=Pararhizobium mangrovi TaxID=2590452 RepID=A0A506UEQ6_9HYPH|nr:dipeptide ABC transporter ATP-binding protein [Pararhizobium mangrovi]TPW31259.1 dipeptide ABC transporter ATP-binding protein [Pararhizobium mangrovi]